jgi:hypothetical protein
LLFDFRGLDGDEGIGKRGGYGTTGSKLIQVPRRSAERGGQVYVILLGGPESADERAPSTLHAVYSWPESARTFGPRCLLCFKSDEKTRKKAG